MNNNIINEDLDVSDTLKLCEIIRSSKSIRTKHSNKGYGAKYIYSVIPETDKDIKKSITAYNKMVLFHKNMHEIYLDGLSQYRADLSKLKNKEVVMQLNTL